MAQITATLNGSALPSIEQQFLNTPIEATADVVTLDNSIYTDFTAPNASGWTFNYDSLTKAEYDLIRAAYDSQFTVYEYPSLSIPFYGLDSVPARMYINAKDIWDNCGDVQNVQITFREQYGEGQTPDFLELDNDELLSMEDNGFLVL